MSNKTLTMLAVGDIILHDTMPSEPLFALVTPVLKSADIVVGQGETPWTSRGANTYVDMMCQTEASNPTNMSAFSAAGFNVLHLAGNHIWDLGAPGVEDTIAGLRKLGIAFCGAGMNIDDARRPAIIRRGGTRFGFLSYNCVGPKGSWATHEKPGCAYVHIIAAYEIDVPVIGGYPTTYTFAEPSTLKAMEEDIHKLRPLCDILVVHFHKGFGLIPAKISMYDQQVSYAAIDAGADLIVAEHAHILKGIEQYKGKVIFHGLGNFVTTPKNREMNPQELDKFIKAQGGRFLFERGGKETPSFPFPERPMTIIAKCKIDDRRISQVSYLPCLINKQSQPEILKNDERGQQVFDYMDNITKGEGLNVRYKWEGDEVLIHTG